MVHTTLVFVRRDGSGSAIVLHPGTQAGLDGVVAYSTGGVIQDIRIG